MRNKLVLTSESFVTEEISTLNKNSFKIIFYCYF